MTDRVRRDVHARGARGRPAGLEPWGRGEVWLGQQWEVSTQVGIVRFETNQCMSRGPSVPSAT